MTFFFRCKALASRETIWNQCYQQSTVLSPIRKRTWLYEQIFMCTLLECLDALKRFQKLGDSRCIRMNQFSDSESPRASNLLILFHDSLWLFLAYVFSCNNLWSFFISSCIAELFALIIFDNCLILQTLLWTNYDLSKRRQSCLMVCFWITIDLSKFVDAFLMFSIERIKRFPNKTFEIQ